MRVLLPILHLRQISGPSTHAHERVYEVDPLVCPACGGEMRVVAFILDHDVVDAILRHGPGTETQRMCDSII